MGYAEDHFIVIGTGPDGEDILLRVTAEGYLVSQLMVFDSETTNDWIRAAADEDGRIYVSQEFTGDLTLTMGDVEKLLADHYYQRLHPYLYASGRLKYICRNTDIDAALADVDWRIWKLTDASQPAKEGPRTGRADSDANITADHSWNI